jgi:hypothetical protein
MLSIKIENEVVTVKKGVSAKNGKPYEIREQSCIVYGVGRFPLETRIALPDNIDGYKAGDYEVTSALTVGRFGLEVSRDLGLVAIKAAAKQQQAA